MDGEVSVCSSFIGDEGVCAPGTSLHQLCSEAVAKSLHRGEKTSTDSSPRRPKLLISFTNYGYFDMAHNFLVALERIGIYNVIMFALDLPSFQKLKTLNKPTWLLQGREQTVYTESSSSFGSPEFNSICNVKPWIVLECLKGGYDVVWTDTDVIWLRDAQPFFDINPSVDLQLQGDDDDICAGFFYAKSTPANVTLLQKVIGYVNTCMDDQTALRRFLHEEEGLANRLTNKPADLAMTHLVDWKEPLKYELKSGLTNYLVLPRSLFPNGTAYYNIKLPQRFGIVPFVIHNNCIIGHDSKVDRFKMYGHWYIGSSEDFDFADEACKVRRLPQSFSLAPHREVVTCLSIHPDGNTLFTAAYDKTVKVYKLKELLRDKNDSEITAVRPTGGGLLNRRGGVWCMAWSYQSPSSSSPATAITPSVADILKLAANPRPPQVPSPADPALFEHNLEPLCYTGGHDRHVMVWETARGLETEIFANQGPWKQRHVLKGHQSVVNAVAFHRDQVFSASDDGTVRSWNPTSGERTRIFRGGSGWVTSVAVDGPALFAASQDGCAYAWDIASARLVQVYMGHQGWLRSIVVNGPKKRVYTAGSDSSIREWDMIPGDCLRTIHHAHQGGINALALDYSSNILYSASDDGLTRAWDLSTLRPVAEYAGHSGIVTCILLTPNYLISGGADHSVRVWPLATTQEVPL